MSMMTHTLPRKFSGTCTDSAEVVARCMMVIHLFQGMTFLVHVLSLTAPDPEQKNNWLAAVETLVPCCCFTAVVTADLITTVAWMGNGSCLWKEVGVYLVTGFAVQGIFVATVTLALGYVVLSWLVEGLVNLRRLPSFFVTTELCHVVEGSEVTSAKGSSVTLFT